MAFMAPEYIKDIPRDEKDRWMLCADLEMTCWATPDEQGDEVAEIIQFGYCFLNLVTAERIGPFELLIHPSESSISDYCMELTGLTPRQLRRGSGFEQTLKRMSKIGLGQFPWAAYGNDDQAFVAQCARLGHAMPLSVDYLNIAPVAARMLGLKRPSLSTVMQVLGLDFEGQAHNAAWDAWNLASVISKLWKIDANVRA